MATFLTLLTFPTRPTKKAGKYAGFSKEYLSMLSYSVYRTHQGFILPDSPKGQIIKDNSN